MMSLDGIPSTTSVFSAYATFAGSAVLVRTVLNEFQRMANQLLPKRLQDKILSKLGALFGNLSSSPMSLTIDEYSDLIINEMFEASDVYLRANISPSVHKLKVSKSAKEKDLCIAMSKGETILDVFEGIHLVWKFVCSESQRSNFEHEGCSSDAVEKQSFELVFSKQYKDKVLNSYLPYVLERSKAIKEKNKVIKLYSLGHSYGGSSEGVNLEHPSTFATLAMDPEVKKALMDDLDRFVRRRAFYKKVGKAWKRGYLLYGPPGTGKSSLVAAMANYLKFDIYDLELWSLRSNSELKRLLLSTKNRSILVIEDIDCSIELKNREAGIQNSEGRLTLSGLLNFIDGLWSSCGDERIIVFTTNYKERLDPALFRPGRMDMHIHMSYCTHSGFKILASNYLGLESHSKFSEIEKLITEAEVTPAEIAEELMKSDDDVDAALGALIDFLGRKKHGKVESNISKAEDQDKVEEKTQEVETKAGTKKRLRRSMRRRRQKCRI